MASVRNDDLARSGDGVQRIAQERIIEARTVEIVRGRHADEDDLRVLKDGRIVHPFRRVVERNRDVLRLEPALESAAYRATALLVFRYDNGSPGPFAAVYDLGVIQFYDSPAAP